MQIPNLESVKSFLAGIADGVVRSFGEASPKLVLIPAPDGEGTVALIRDGYEIETLPGKHRNQRAHVFADLTSYAEWLNRHANDRQGTEILATGKEVVAALTPGVVDGDVVRCTLAPHPRLARWLGVFGREIGQRDLHKHVLGALEDFQAATDPRGNAAGSFGEHLAGQITKLDIVSGGQFTHEIDERGMVRFSGRNEKNEVVGQIPPRFKIVVPWLIGVRRVADGEPAGEAFYTLEALVRMQVKPAGPVFTLECPGLEVVQREALRDGIAWLRHQLEPEFLVGLGDLSLKNVPVVAA